MGAGVLGALQLDRWLESRLEPSADSLASVVPTRAPVGSPASFDPAAAPSSVDFRGAAKRVNASVVSVDRYQKVRRGFFESEVSTVETGSGSGVILSSDGLIVTNNHVVQGASEVKVRLPDKRSVVAKVLGSDPRSDLAVLRISTKNLQPIEVGTSSNLEIGQWVMAVGNPLGFDNTVSVGVVSSLKRNLPVGQSGLVDAIQTDAAINPGNSGGALCDTQGRLIGINSAIASNTGTSVGIGFAIPVDRVKKIVNDIVTVGYARYAGLGITYREDWEGALGDPNFRATLAERLGAQNVPSRGVVVWETIGSAANAGIERGSVILSIAGENVDGSFDINRVLTPRKIGDSVTVKFWTRGATKTAEIKLSEVGRA